MYTTLLYLRKEMEVQNLIANMLALVTFIFCYSVPSVYHSFIQKLIIKYFHVLDVKDTGFKKMDEASVSVMLLT